MWSPQAALMQQCETSNTTAAAPRLKPQQRKSVCSRTSSKGCCCLRGTSPAARSSSGLPILFRIKNFRFWLETDFCSAFKRDKCVCELNLEQTIKMKIQPQNMISVYLFFSFPDAQMV